MGMENTGEVFAGQIKSLNHSLLEGLRECARSGDREMLSDVYGVNPTEFCGWADLRDEAITHWGSTGISLLGIQRTPRSLNSRRNIPMDYSILLRYFLLVAQGRPQRDAGLRMRLGLDEETSREVAEHGAWHCIEQLKRGELRLFIRLPLRKLNKVSSLKARYLGVMSILTDSPKAKSKGGFVPLTRQPSVYEAMLRAGVKTTILSTLTGFLPRKIARARTQFLNAGELKGVSYSGSLRTSHTILYTRNDQLAASLFVAIYLKLSPEALLFVDSRLFMQSYWLYSSVHSDLWRGGHNKLNVNEAWVLARDYRSHEVHVCKSEKYGLPYVIADGQKAPTGCPYS